MGFPFWKNQPSSRPGLNAANSRMKSCLSTRTPWVFFKKLKWHMLFKVNKKIFTLQLRVQQKEVQFQLPGSSARCPCSFPGKGMSRELWKPHFVSRTTQVTRRGRHIRGNFGKISGKRSFEDTAFLQRRSPPSSHPTLLLVFTFS